MNLNIENKVSRCVEVCRKIAAIPTAIKAELLTAACDDVLFVRSMWSSQDFVELEKNKFSWDFVIDKESLKVLSSGFPSNMGSVLLHSFSKSGEKLAVLTGNKSQDKRMYIEIWNGSKKEFTFDMTECEEHGNITYTDPFKCFEWSSDERFLLYTAEAKKPKYVSYFKDTSVKEGDKSIVKGEEHLYRENWGENCTGVHHTVLCILEIDTRLIQVLPTDKIGTEISFGQASWGPKDKSIIFIGWSEFPYRLGLWACRNRRSALYTINLESKDIECFTPEENICVRSPRLSPNLDTLIYLENPSSGPHFKAAKLKKCDLKTKKITTVLDIVRNPKQSEFPGIYLDYLPIRCWSEDEKYVYFSTTWRSCVAIVCLHIESGLVHKVYADEKFGSALVLDIRKNIIISQFSAPNADPCLGIGRINPKNIKEIAWTFLDECSPNIHSDVKWFIKTLIPPVPNEKYSNLDFEIIVVSPAETQKGNPLIVIPHGGPHACYTAGHMPGYIRFVLLGYIVCLVNYRGSIGFGEDNLDSLPGNVGVQDVADVQQAALHVKNDCGFDIGDVFIFGGSHGGFLGAHMCGQFPDFYKAAALLNPVIDMSCKVNITDIPDSNWVEGGLGYLFDSATIMNPDHLKVLWEKSPISHLDNVCAPTLLLLGEKDIRVPMSEGRRCYQLLRARKVPVKMYVYKDNHQLQKTSHNGDFFIQTALWFHHYSSAKCL